MKTPKNRIKKKSPGRKPHEPTRAQRKTVLEWTRVGMPQESIARFLEISLETLEKHYRRELDIGADQANAKVANKLYTRAMAGDVAAIIWWSKTRLRWAEKRQTEISGPEGKPIELSKVSDLDLLESIAKDAAEAAQKAREG